uniref:Uncharacterized protein n=1 Tax=Globodera rostochiensis TaxID=31243 RepID=A0A914HGP3_GLORO
MSENIRTGKQLTPTLSFHFWMVFASALTAYWSYFEIPGFAYMLMAGNIANVEALMIALRCHPFLKRDAISTLRRIFVFKRPTNRVHDDGGQQTTKCAKNNNRKSIAMHDLINGKALVVSSMGQDIYFDSLWKYWNEGKCAK